MPRMRALLRAVLALAVMTMTIIAPAAARAFPDAEKVWDAGGGPPFGLGLTSSTSGFLLMTDIELAVSYGETLSLINMGAFDYEPEQPPELTSETTGVIGGISYASGSSQIYASQETGFLLIYTLSDITTDPLSLQVLEGDVLGPLAFDPNTGYAYMADNTAKKVISFNAITGETIATITLTVPGQTAFTITDALYVSATREIYFTTDVGALFYIASGGTAAAMIGVATGSGNALSAVAEMPSGSQVYVADYDGNAVYVVSTSSHTVQGSAIDLDPNVNPTDVKITQVANPSATYAYVAGALGVSVINTSTGEVLDMGEDPGTDHEPIPTTAEPLWLAVSSLEDGNVYVNFNTGDLGIITDRPLAAFSSITYSGGGSSMGAGDSVDIVFLSDSDGTYEFRAGGDIYGSGTLLVDASGSTSGSVIADTETTVTIPYGANSSAFDEGANDLWVFVTSDSLQGRRLSSVTVDTPPPDVVVRSTGFGNKKVYVNFDRIDVSDMASYNVYVDTDPDAVLTKTDVAASVAQPSGGSTVTGEVGGLTNGTTYYMAVEAVDEAGNKSPNRTATLPDGTRATAMPEKTVGPASGEGCTLVRGASGPMAVFLVVLPALAALGLARLRRSRAILAIALIAAMLAFSATAMGQPRATSTIEETEASSGIKALENNPPHWDFEIKTGFWMPQSSNLDRYFDTCCNLITRLQGGYMFQERYGVELSAGILWKTGKARGEESGEISQDSFTFLMFPIQTSFVWRVDYFTWRYLIPYMKAGFDGIVYYESVAGDSVTGIKWGMHAAGGAMLNISEMTKTWGDTDLWVDEFFMTFETEYMYVNSFGSGTLNLSGPVFSVGLLFYF